MTKVAISACLTGELCRYDARDNYDEELLGLLAGYELTTFCPEDTLFGSPRPTMDLMRDKYGIRAISNLTGEDLSAPIISYAKSFFDKHSDIEFYIGKDRSPSCAVKSGKLYDSEKNLLSTTAMGLMSAEAKRRGIMSIDAESYKNKGLLCD